MPNQGLPQRIFKVMETALHVYENKQQKVPTAQLNERFLPLIENYPPPATKGKYIKIKYCTQLPSITQLNSDVLSRTITECEVLSFTSSVMFDDTRVRI